MMGERSLPALLEWAKSLGGLLGEANPIPFRVPIECLVNDRGHRSSRRFFRSELNDLYPFSNMD